MGARYTEWCSRDGRPSWPPQFRSMAGYICAHVARNGGSTRSVANLISQLRVYAKKHNLGWLSEAAAYRLRRLSATLRFHDTQPSRAKSPATLAVISTVLQHLDLRRLDERLFAITVLVGHNGLLRGAELHSGIRAGSLIWTPDHHEVSMTLSRTKTHRSGPPVTVTLRRYNGPCAYTLLYRWFEEHRLWDRPAAYVFPKVKKHQGAVSLDFDTPLSRASWNRDLKRHFGAAGLDPCQYTGHSLRAGGATDLFTAGTPYPVIKKAGRWKSDTALQYFRERDHVAQEVARSFGRQFRIEERKRKTGRGVADR